MPDPAISGVFAESRGGMLPATVAMRQRAMSDFLHTCGWGGAVHAPLAGDASFRSYYRLSRGRDRAVLMDAPPPHGDGRREHAAPRFGEDAGNGRIRHRHQPRLVAPATQHR